MYSTNVQDLGVNTQQFRSWYLEISFHIQCRYSREIPDAYERLLLDAIEGERRLFIRSDELDAAWAIFTPLLKELEMRKVAIHTGAVDLLEHIIWLQNTMYNGEI